MRTNSDESILYNNRNKRMRVFIDMNYTHQLFYIFLCLLVIYSLSFICHKRKKENDRIPMALMIAALAYAIVYQYMFKNGSFIHNYWMYNFITPLMLILAYNLNLIKDKNNGNR